MLSCRKCPFEVKRMAVLFEVSADNINVSVLGTTFVVKSEGATKEVKVLEGRVAVQTNASIGLRLQESKAWF